MNPAYIASRGMSPIYLNNSLLWWHGTDFIVNPKQFWQVQTKFSDKPNEKFQEDMRKVKVIASVAIHDCKSDKMSEKFEILFRKRWRR